MILEKKEGKSTIELNIIKRLAYLLYGLTPKLEIGGGVKNFERQGQIFKVNLGNDGIINKS